MPTLLDEVLARVQGMDVEARQGAVELSEKKFSDAIWLATPGPQLQAFLSPADLLLYGGQGGGGKTDLLSGLALTKHIRSLIMRRQYTDLGAIIDRTTNIAGTTVGLNKSPPPQFRFDGRLIDFGAATNMDAAETWQGNPHDFIAFDEACQFIESVVRFLMGWNRVADEELGGESLQRCRVVMATNPPLTAEGQWIIPMFGPWLDETYPKPAKHGELRWFVTDPDGNDMEVDGPDDIREFTDSKGVRKTYIPKSRTFIPAALSDNPFLINTGYQATLDQMQEPMRSAIRDGNFMAAREDVVNQAIPTAWVMEANRRWAERPPHGIPMCAMGVDTSGGGRDPMMIAMRYDGWYAPLIEVAGSDLPPEKMGKTTAGIVVANRRDICPVIVDMGGGYGGPLFEHLRENDITAISYKGAEGSKARTADRQLGFYNRRSQAIWQFREALDPDQDGGSPIALPIDPVLMADLTAATFEIGPRGIKVETKEHVVARLGRSTDRGDAVVMCWFGGERRLMDAGPEFARSLGRNRKPQVHTKKSMRAASRRRV